MTNGAGWPTTSTNSPRTWAVQRLEYVGREVVIGERWDVQIWANGQEQTVGGLRLDLRARDFQPAMTSARSTNTSAITSAARR